jgi:hypothetical protein
MRIAFGVVCWGSPLATLSARQSNFNRGTPSPHWSMSSAAVHFAGAFYGEEGIPEQWLARVAMRNQIGALAEKLGTTQHRLP